MFGSLIRRKPAGKTGADEAAFDSTTFSLSMAVPRPIERREEQRLLSTLRVAKLSSALGEQLIRLRNVSAGGLMAECKQPPAVGEQVEVEADQPWVLALHVECEVQWVSCFQRPMPH